ncbi:hypothetical protein Hanom_Chr13g01223271 [Helianthus anomalus]
MVWRFKDQTMSFDLGNVFVFNKELAHALIDHRSPIRPLPEYFLLLGRVCFSWGQWDRDWPVIRMKRGRNVEMSLRDALKVPNFNVMDFDLDEQAEGEIPFIQQVAYAAQEIRPLTAPGTSEPTAEVATSSIPTPIKGAAGSFGSQVGKKSILDDVDSDPEVRSLDEALRRAKIRSSDPLPMPKPKKNKRGSSHSSSDVMVELDGHLTGGKFSREEAARARSAPTPTFSGGFLPVNEVESTTLDSSLGPDRFIDDEEDQVSSLPPSWFRPELMSFFRYADVFSDDMEIDPATAEEKFVPDWDIRNKDSVMDELVARTLLFKISTPLDHARSRRMKNQDLGDMVLSN